MMFLMIIIPLKNPNTPVTQYRQRTAKKRSRRRCQISTALRLDRHPAFTNACSQKPLHQCCRYLANMSTPVHSQYRCKETKPMLITRSLR